MMTTPFARLGYLEKQSKWGWGDTAGLAGDVVASTNPVIGIPYYGAKAGKDFAGGNWGGGLANLGWGALSLFAPGAGSLAKGVKIGTKALGGLRQTGRLASTAAKTSQVGKTLVKGNQAMRGFVGRSPMLANAGQSYKNLAGSSKAFRWGAPIAAYTGVGLIPNTGGGQEMSPPGAQSASPQWDDYTLPQAMQQVAMSDPRGRRAMMGGGGYHPSYQQGPRPYSGYYGRSPSNQQSLLQLYGRGGYNGLY